MIKKKEYAQEFASFIFILIAACSVVSAQAASTPEKGSAERKAILTALRAPVERELKQKIVFAADHFKVLGNWAYVSGSPQTSAGGRPNYRNTPYSGAVDSGAFDNNFFALLKKTNGRWRVVQRALGCTDVCYLDWWRIHEAPEGDLSAY